MQAIWQEYAAKATNTKQISNLEAHVIKIFPLQTEACQNKIAYHWQNFKVAQSALTLTSLASDAWLYGTKPRDSSNVLWAMIQVPSQEKRSVPHLFSPWALMLDRAIDLSNRSSIKAVLCPASWSIPAPHSPIPVSLSIPVPRSVL